MSNPEREYIREVAKELATAMHQSRDSELSGLFADLKKDVKDFKSKQDDIHNREDAFHKSFEEFKDMVRSEFDSLKQRAVRWDMTNNIVWGAVALVLTAVLTAIVGLIIIK